MLPVSNTKEQKALSLQEYKCPSTYDTTSQYSIVLTSRDILLEQNDLQKKHNKSDQDNNVGDGTACFFEFLLL